MSGGWFFGVSKHLNGKVWFNERNVSTPNRHIEIETLNPVGSAQFGMQRFMEEMLHHLGH